MSSVSLEEPVVTVSAPESTTEKHSYGEILRSSAWVGGSTVLNIGIGIVRTKILSILLGPAGFGLNGLYSSITDVAQSIAGMGVNSSGVRQIAESVGTGDQIRIARTAAVLRRTSLLLGVFGALLVAVFARQISQLTFGTTKHTAALGLLSIAVLFKLVANGQTALIQGMRRISDLAKMNVLGAGLGLLLSIPLVYFFREEGIAPGLACVAAMTIAASWWYSRKIRVPAMRVTAADVKQELSGLLKLGFAFMISGFLTMGAAYAVRILLLRRSGVAATGYYQAAWTLGGLYVGIILQAMGADFYPRLTAQANDNRAVNTIVNEQTKVGLLLAGPGVLATLVFAPVILLVFYSAKFHPALDLLRWLSLGTFLQVISWPMGFIVLAKGRQLIFLASDFAWAVVYLALAWALIGWIGTNGAGIAFCGSYAFHTLLNYVIARRLSTFRLARENGRLILSWSVLTALLATASFTLSARISLWLGIVGFLGGSYFSVSELLTAVPVERLPRRLHAELGALDRGSQRTATIFRGMRGSVNRI